MNLEAYQHVRSGGTATRILEAQSLWRLAGPDRVRYLNGQVTNDVTTLPEGEARLAAVCTAKGRMEGVVFMASQSEELFLDAEPILRDSLGPRLEKYLIADDAVLDDISDSWRLSHVFGSAPSIPSAPGFIVRNARFGPPGHDVWMPGDDAFVSGDVLENDVCETLRLEHGIPRWGAELTAQTLPPEGGPIMLRAISYTKGCYVGQETIARLKSIGHVNRTLVCLRSDSVDCLAVGTKLSHAGKEAGTVTSSGFSSAFQAGLMLAYLPPALDVPGTQLQAGNLTLKVISPLGVGAAP